MRLRAAPVAALAFSAAALTAFAPAAKAYSGQGADCGISLSQPAPDLHYYEAFLPAFKEVFEKASPESVPASEAAASKAICGDEGCPGGGVYTDYRNGNEVHGIIFNDDGSGMWVVSDVGWIGGNSACNIGEPTVSKVGDGLYLFALQERNGDFLGEDDAYCTNETETNSALLLDLKTKQWLVVAANVGESTLTVEGDRVRIAACDGLKLDVTLDLLRDKKGSVAGTAGAGTAASKAVTLGRKLTKKKDWDGAIAAFKKAIEADPATATAWSGLGFAQLGKGLFDDADWSFQKALAEGGTDKYKAMVWYNRGLVAERKKDKAAATMAFENAHLLAPSKATAKKLGKPAPK